MSRRPSSLETRVKRAILNFQKAGIAVRRIEIDAEGKIAVDLGGTEPAVTPIAADDPFGAWEAKRNASRAQGN